MRNNTTDLLASQLTIAFLKSGLTTAEFVQHIIDTRKPIDASVTKEHAHMCVAIPTDKLNEDGEVVHLVHEFYKYHDSNHWGCKV